MSVSSRTVYIRALCTPREAPTPSPLAGQGDLINFLQLVECWIPVARMLVCAL